MRIPKTSVAVTARRLTLLSSVLAAGFLCSAADITYNVNQTIGAGGVTGDIVTDGTIGVIETANILDWNLELNDGTNSVDLLGPLSGTTSTVSIYDPSGLSATATQLLFDFSAGSLTYLLFDGSSMPSVGYLCFTSQPCTAGLTDGGEQVTASLVGSGGANDENLQSSGLFGTDVIGTFTPSTPPSGVPEPSSFAILSGGMALLGWRKRCAK